MKITSEHLERLKSLLEPVIAKYPISEYRRTNPEFSDTRVRWDYFWASDFPTKNALMNEIYEYANDTHLNTALKAIVGR
jgi:hypothetical protein